MHPSPLRSISNQQPPVTAYQDLVKEATVMRQDINQKDYELYEHERQQRQQFSENQTFVHQIQNLEGDKVQWIKRMNALLVEKDRLVQEKTDLAAELHETRLRCEELERKFQHIGRKQAAEKLVTSDLKAEREENMRLRDIIHSLETERAELRAKIRETEMNAAGLTRDRTDLTGKLQQRMDHVALLESDNRALQEQLRTLKIQISDFDLERAAHAHDRGSLRETISRLEADKAEALVRISELGARHENYVQAIGNEKTSIEWMHRRQLRVLASRSIAQALQELALRRKNRRFAELKGFLLYERRKVRESGKLAVAAMRLRKAAEKSAIDRWRDCLDWPMTAAVRQNAVAKYVFRRSTSVYFQAWKAFTHTEVTERKSHNHGISRLFSLFLSRIQAVMRGRISRWRGAVDERNSRNKIAQSLVYRGSVGKMRHALRTWRGAVSKTKHEQAKEDVSTVLSSTLLLQAVLSGWKTVSARTRGREMLIRVQQRTSERLRQTVALHALKRYLDSRKQQQMGIYRVLRRATGKDLKSAFGYWRQETKDLKHTETLAKVVARQHYKRYATVLEKVFYAWKSLLLGSKVSVLESRLQEEVPRRQALEADLHQTLEQSHRSSVTAVLRLATKRLTTQLRPFVRHWHSVCERMKATHPSLRRFLVTWYWKKQEEAFRTWHSLVLNTDLARLYQANQGLADNTRTLTEHIGNLEQVLAHREEERTGLTRRSLVTAVKSAARFQLRDAVRKWAQTALRRYVKETSSEQLGTKLAKVVYSRAFASVRSFAVNRKKAEVRDTRLRYLYAKTFRTMLFTTFAAWKEYRATAILEKSILKRVIARMALHQEAAGIELWRTAVFSQKAAEAAQVRQRLLEERELLNGEVNKLSSQLQSETNHRTALARKIHESAQKRVANTIVRLLTNSAYRSFASWRNVTVRRRKQSHKSITLNKVFHKQEMRIAIRVWQFFASKTRKLMLQEQVVQWQREQKETRRQLKATQDELEAVVIAKDEVIAVKEAQIGVLEGRFSAVLDRVVRDQRTEYSLSKAGYVFKFWSNRYRLLKSALQKLMDVGYRSVLKSSLFDVREFARDRANYTSFTEAINTWLDGFTARRKRSGFALWRSKAKQTATAELQDQFAQKSALANSLQSALNSQKEKTANYAFAESAKTVKGKALIAWKLEAGRLRRLRSSHHSFASVARTARLKVSIDRLMENRDAGKLSRSRVAHLLANRQSFYRRRIFNAMRENAVGMRRMSAVFSMLDRRFAREGQLLALEAIQRVAAVVGLQTDHHFEKRDETLRKMLTTVCYGRLARGFRTWAQNSLRAYHSRDVLRKAILRSLHRKYSSAVSLWKEHQSFLHISHYFVTESPLVTENQMLQHRIEIYARLIQDEGMDQKHVENYILERESLAEALKWKGVSRMRYAAGMTEKSVEDQTAVLPRAFLTWKVWVSKRKKVKRLANRMKAYRSNPCMGAFHTWKHGLPLVRSALASYTRPNLIALIAKMDRDIKTMEGMVEDHNKRLSYLQIYSSLLEQHTRRGRNQSLIVLSRQVRSPLHQAVSRWHYIVTCEKMEEMRQQITALDDSYHVLALKYEQLEQEYNIVFDENNELRQATLDGLDLADAIETLSKERERLSVDLAERAATIKQLLEENNELAARMRAAQKEAEALRVLTAPERDMRFA